MGTADARDRPTARPPERRSGGTARAGGPPGGIQSARRHDQAGLVGGDHQVHATVPGSWAVYAAWPVAAALLAAVVVHRREP
ncbi:hypothetical protein [Micromonospora sp. NPDC049282]|uniref:hypothetical protein n=1 Tax=Micromonospora sp. NPDC049282 TaxID=3364269 RepID=UPI0037229084